MSPEVGASVCGLGEEEQVRRKGFAYQVVGGTNYSEYVKNELSVVRGRMMFLDLRVDRISDKIVCDIGNSAIREVRGESLEIILQGDNYIFLFLTGTVKYG